MEVLTVAYETKALLMALARIIARADTKEEIYEAVADIANVEGVVLKPYEEMRAGRKN